MEKLATLISNVNRKVKCSNHRSNVFGNNKRLSLQGLNRPINFDVKENYSFLWRNAISNFRNTGKQKFLLFSEGQMLSPKKRLASLFRKPGE